MASETVTFEQAEAKRQKAVDFLNRMGNTNAADEFDALTTQDYIDHKGLNVVNSPPRRNRMPETKADLQRILDSVQDLLESVYTPESSREDFAAAVGDALDQLAPEDDSDLDDSDSDDFDNGD